MQPSASSGEVNVWDLSRHVLVATHSWPGRVVINAQGSPNLSHVAVVTGPQGAQARPPDLRVWAA